MENVPSPIPRSARPLAPPMRNVPTAPNGTTSCIQGTCQKQQVPVCPSACTTDTQCVPCGAGYKCTGGSCQKSTSGCPASCNNNTDCGNCGSGFVCTSNVCVRPPTPGGPGAACGTATPCSTGNVCVTVSQTASYCFQSCTTNANCASNADGRTFCLSLQSGGGVCVKPLPKGASCSGIGPKQHVCKQGETPPLYCSSTTNTCTAALYVKEGAACNKSGDNTEPIKLCDPSVTPALTCDQTTGKCVKTTTAATNEACGGNTSKSCATQDICVSLSQGAAKRLLLA